MEQTVPNKEKERSSLLPSDNLAPARLIRTMKNDAEEAIKQQHETSVSIAIAEEKKRKAKIQANSTGATSAPKPIGRFIVVIVVFIIIGLLGAGYVFVMPKITAIKLPTFSIPSFNFGGTPKTTTPTETAPVVFQLANSLIRADLQKQISITGATPFQIFPEIATEIKQGVPTGLIKNIYITEDSASGTVSISSSRLFSFANISVPDILSRALDVPFMAGLIGEQNGAATPFLIIKVSDNNAGIAGMLAWEDTLPSLFDLIFGTNIMSKMTPITKFQNFVIGGVDARALNTKPDITISYAFANQNTIVIAGSQTALETLLPLVAKI